MNLTRLAHLEELTERMLLDALNGEWAALEQLQDEHNELAREVFTGINAYSLSEGETVSKIIEIIAQVVDLVEQQKTDIADQLIQLKKSNRVQNAYLQNSE